MSTARSKASRNALWVVFHLSAVAAICIAHQIVGCGLARIDPIAELAAGHRVCTVVAIAAFVPLRFAAWFLALPYLFAFGLPAIGAFVRAWIDDRAGDRRAGGGVPD